MIRIEKQYMRIAISAILVLVVSMFFIINRKSNDSNIKIGAILPLTKSGTHIGLNAKNGINMYVDEVNNSGGIKGKKIECIEYDSEGDPAKAISGYNFLKDQNVAAIIAGGTSAEVLAIVEASQEDGGSMPIMVKAASADGITVNNDTNKVYKNVYRVGFTNSFQGEKMADFAKVLNAKNVAVMYCSEDDYSLGLKKSFANKCNANGINISNFENYPENSVEFKQQLENIKAKKPDAIFIPSSCEAASLIAKQARDIGISCPLLGGDNWSGVIEATSNVSLLNNCFYFSAYSTEDPSEISQAFHRNYREIFNQEPNLFSACAYDVSRVVTSSISLYFDKNPEINKEINYDDLRRHIIDNVSNTNLQCVTGNITFDEFHNPKKQAIIVQIKDGKDKFYQKI